MNLLLKRVVSCLILLILGIWTYAYVQENSGTLSAIFRIDREVLLLLFSVIVLGFVFTGWALIILTAPYGVALHALESISITIVTSFLNTLFPFQGGLGLRGYYLFQRHGLSVQDFAATLAGQLVLAGLAMHLAFSVSNLDVSFFRSLLLAIIASVVLRLNITPGGLGIVEGTLLLAAPLIGVDREAMLIGAVILRGAGICMLLCTTPPAWFLLRRLSGQGPFAARRQKGKGS